MIDTSAFLRLTENSVSQNLKVSNPIIMKTGVLGLLVNLMTIAKTDNANFLNTLVRESSPVTAESYEALFFHSTTKQQNINFSTPSEFQVSFIIPEFDLTVGEVIKYTIDKDTTFTDENNYNYTLESLVEIYISNGTVMGKRYDSDKIVDLDVIRTTHPLDPNVYIYMINTNIKQYERLFKILTVPSGLEESYKFSIDIESISNIYQINAWKQYGSTKTLNVDELKKLNTIDIPILYELEPLDIKYTKALSNQTENHIFLKFQDTSLHFETGDGIFGKKLEEQDKILIELKLTQGVYGNLSSATFNLNNILVQQIDQNNNVQAKTTTLKAVSIHGGTGGTNLESKEDIRRRLVNYRGEYIGSMSDIRNAFYLDRGEPYIDKKYFNSKHHIFIYNIIRDKVGKVIPTTTMNLKLNDLMAKPFLPEIEYNGIEMISPFYYVNFQNRINAYLILPEVKVDLIAESGTSSITTIENNPSVYLTYDWFEKKTYLELRTVNMNYTYVMTTNINTYTFSAGNSFRVEINKTFLNEYCLFDGFAKDAYNPDTNDVIKVPGYLNNIVLTVYNQGVKIIKYIQSNSKKYIQTSLKQEHYYWIDVDQFDTQKETKYVLNIPYIQKKYVTNDIVAAAIKLDNFFKISTSNENINPNLSLCQAFYNTIKIEDIYRNYIFENLDVYVEPIISINMELDINSLNLQRSKWNTTTELETEIQWIVQNHISSIEGFQIEFNESQLESEILTYFNYNYDVVRNIKIWNPSGPIRVKNAVEIQNNFEENYGHEHASLTSEELKELVLKGEIPKVTQKQIVDFVPPYFTFNSNISIEFKLD